MIPFLYSRISSTKKQLYMKLALFAFLFFCGFNISNASLVTDNFDSYTTGVVTGKGLWVAERSFNFTSQVSNLDSDSSPNSLQISAALTQKGAGYNNATTTASIDSISFNAKLVTSHVAVNNADLNIQAVITNASNSTAGITQIYACLYPIGTNIVDFRLSSSSNCNAGTIITVKTGITAGVWHNYQVVYDFVNHVVYGVYDNDIPSAGWGFGTNGSQIRGNSVEIFSSDSSALLYVDDFGAFDGSSHWVSSSPASTTPITSPVTISSKYIITDDIFNNYGNGTTTAQANIVYNLRNFDTGIVTILQAGKTSTTTGLHDVSVVTPDYLADGLYVYSASALGVISSTLGGTGGFIIGTTTSPFATELINGIASTTARQVPQRECSLTNLSGCFFNAMSDLLYPSESSMQQFYTLPTLAEAKVPFVYFTTIQSSLSNASSTSQSLGTFNLTSASSSPISYDIPIFSVDIMKQYFTDDVQTVFRLLTSASIWMLMILAQWRLIPKFFHHKH